jgi:peroxiredoxin
MRDVIAMLLAGALGCVRASEDEVEVEAPLVVDPHVSVIDATYGADPERPDLLALGDRLALDELVLTDGSTLALAEARSVGPVILVWFGGAEHAELTAWVRELAGGLGEFESRGATLVIVRPLPPERAEAFATELGLQVVVAADERGALAQAMKFGDPAPEWAVAIVDRESQLRYRKLAGRRPAPDELLRVIDGDPPRCCIDACGEPACE